MSKLFVLLFFCSCVALSKGTLEQERIVVPQDVCDEDKAAKHEIEIEIGGSYVDAKSNKKWKCAQGDTDCVLRSHRSQPKGELTIRNVHTPRDFRIYYLSKRQSIPLKNDLSELIRVRSKDDLPIHKLAREVINHLNGDIIRHLYWTHNFDRFDNFYPNVGGHFRKRRDVIAARRDQIATYVLEKHATTHHIHGKDSPNYSCSLMSGFTKLIDVSMSGLHSIVQAYEHALGQETKTVGLLTEVMHMAENVDDEELVEFVGADLLPPLLESMKSLANDVSTIKELSKNQLGNYIFDRTNFQSA